MALADKLFKKLAAEEASDLVGVKSGAGTPGEGKIRVSPKLPGSTRKTVTEIINKSSN